MVSLAPRERGVLPAAATSPVKRDMVRVHTNHIALQERVPEGPVRGLTLG
jgi:hypothetical protein